MSDRIDIEAGIRAINKAITEKDFRPRDADGNDYAYGDDPGLRFKTGCQHGEVTVTVWRHNRQIEAIRVLADEQIVEAKYRIDQLIEEFFSERRAYQAGNETSDRWSPR